jgi:hypothetical protein
VKERDERSQADVMRLDGMNVPSRDERAAARTRAEAAPRYAEVKKLVIGIYGGFFDHELSDDELLATDPNDFDADPSIFYETLVARFGVPYDEEHDYFGGYGGTIADTIAFITPRWDGMLRDGSERADAATEPDVPPTPTSRDADADADATIARDKLIALAVQKGFVTYDDVSDALPEDAASGEQIDSVLSALAARGIKIV